ncbi:coiled-coil domain-containing protein 160 [Phyllobates terribilis]|uniref:coiled-coil domain-containing protein 160 n=1 Tax=Phyllobates terribilis TaxID=111132 RepID=UPI003CCB1185
MANNTKHWVEELFSPRFNTEDFLRESFEPELLMSEKRAKERASTMEEIYRAAVCEFQEKEKRKKKKLMSEMIIREDQAVTAQHTTCESCLKRDIHSSTASENGGHCLWNEKELNLLRAEMNKKHSEGARFSFQLSACKLEISELKVKQKETERKLEALKMALAASKRENECKLVLINQLKKDGEKREADLRTLRKDMHKKHAMVQKLTTSMSKAREEVHHLQLHNTDLQQELNTLQHQQELKIIIASEKTKLQYDTQIKKLLREIETLKEERQVVRHQHAQDVAELDLLRRLYIHDK